MSTRKQMQIPSTTLAVDTVTIATTTTKNTAASALEVFETADATNVNVTSTTTPEATSLLTAAASTATTTTSTANISLQLPYDNLNKAEMGGNVSSEFESALQESDSANSKQEGKIIQLTSNRVTRSSPLLPNSPVNRKSDQMNNLLEINECNNSENEEMSCAAVVPKRVNQIRARKSIKEAKELQQQQQQQQQQHPDKTYTKEDNNSEQKEAKDKDVKDATTTIASRLTRKSLALQEVACINTRVTRQQRQSTTNRSEARSETPPARSKVIRGNAGRGKMSLPNSNEAAICKRKRSLDTRCLSTEEPLIKCIKTETKEDFDDDDEEFLSVSHITNASSTDSSIGETPSKIKQEILEESENESESVTVSTGAIVDGGEVGNVCGGSTSNIAKGRNNKSGSNSGKKSGACIISLSPSTRSTRQTKSNSPAASSSAKRTRITTNSRCVLRNTVGGGNNNNKKQRLPSNITDDDELSKDGSVYSNITDDVILANIKSELTENDAINNNNNDSSIAQNVVEEHERPKEKNTAKSPIKQSSNNITVIISNTQMDISKVNLTNSLTTEKISYSNSLKPLINNVNEHSKQSECLENDIDIRKDPKINAITEGKQTNTTSGDSHTSVKIVEVNNPDNSLKQEGTSCFNDDKNNSNKKLFSTQLNVVLEDNDNLMDNDDEPVLIINEDDLPEEEDNQRYVKNNEPIGEHYELHNEDLIINENKCISMDNNDPADITFENVEPQDTTPLINKEHEIEKINTNKNANIIKFTNDETKSAVNDTPDKIDNESEKLDEYVKENLSKIDKPDESDNSSDAIAKDDDATETLKMKFDAEANEKLTDPDNISVVLNSKKDDKNFEQTITVLMLEHDEEILRQKEQHLQTLGLVTHKAAEKRRIEVQQSSAANVEASKAAVAAAVVQQPQTHYGKRNGKHTATTQHTVTTVTSIGNHSNALSGAPTITTSTTSHPEYTGTLKTVIKLSRNSTGYAANGATNRRKSPQTVPAGIVTAKEQQPPQLQQQHRRQSLKMTFQKGRGRAHGQSNGDRHQHNDRENNAEDNYYTIQNENEESNNSSNNNSNQQTNQSLSNTNNSNNNTANNNNNNHNNNNNNNKIVEQEEILIPEKASSFKFHPGRLCEDQCFYCSGTFGLYDTPCHVGQIKSKERQQKILASEEKLTVDNCLCDACFRHVDRRANVPSYKKRIIVLQDNMGPSTSAAAARKATNETQANENETNNNFNNNHNNGNSDLMVAAQNGNNTINNNNETHENIRNCMVNDCMEIAAHSLRRKCLRKNAKKFLLNFEMPPTAPILWLCQTHYDAATRGLACVLCKRRLAKHYMYRVSDIDRLQKTLAEMGIPVKLGSSRATCKLCRYFANLLTKPTASNKSAEKVEFIQNYRKRLLQFHNIHIDSSEPSEADEEDSNGASVVEVLTANVLQKSPLTEKALNVLEDDPLTIKGDLMITKSIMNSSEIGANSTVITMAVNHNNLNNNKNTMSVENITHETMDRDCECTPLNTDSSSSSSNLSIEISNKNALTTTATTTIQSTDSMSIPLSSPNDTQQMSKLKAILQNNTQTILLPSSVEKKNNKSPTTDISTVLRANPNLSMRELFPGEEDLGLHFKVPFGISNSQRTPEGWTRVDTFLQYDEATRRLWEELQKPYGNQSSFLRHLILLEKYYRNGDLILSPNASSNASVYTQTVRQRLTSFDQGHCGGLQEAGTMDKTSEVASIKNQIIHELEIPTVEINEEDDEDEQAVIVDRNNKNDNVIVTSPDVEVRPIPKRQSASGSSVLENKTTKHQAIQRSRSLSVDKLTKQLNTQAVTIIARPKDHMYPKTNSSNGSNNGGYNANKTNIGSPQKSLLKDNLMVPIMTTSSNSISQCSTPTHTNLVAPNLSGSSTTLSASTNANLTSNSNSRSILKCNLLGINKSVEILPVLSCNASNTGSSDSPSLSSISNKTCAPVNLTSSRNINTYTSATGPITSEVSKQHVILDAANKLVQAAAAAGQGTVKNPPNAASLLSSPPELVSLHRRSITNQPASIASCRNNGSSNHNNIIPSNNSNTNKRLHVIGKTGSSRPAPNIVILPDTLTPQERMQSKSWRPTLMPVKENLNLFNKSGPLYQTADGRRLPGLVQVQSGGKPFLISIFDYNRMCILRREKLMRDQMLKATKKRQEDKKQQQSQQQQHQQQPQIAKTNVTHVHKNATNQANATSRQQQQQQQQHHQQQVAQQQLLQLQLLQQHQQALLKAAGNSNALNASGLNVTRYQPTTSKQPNGTTTSATASVTNIINSDINTPPPLSSTNATFSTPMIPLLANAISSATNNCTSWLWNNFPDANQLLMNGIGCTGTGVSMAATITNANANNGSTTSTSISMPKLPHLLTSKNSNACVTTSSMPAITLTHANAIKQQQQQHQQQLLLSKIPKSLTVIPQHKLMNVPASTALGTNISTTNTQNNMKE